MIQQQISQDNLTDSEHPFSAILSGYGSVNLSDLEDGYQHGPERNLLTICADGISGEGSNWTGLQDYPSKVRQRSATPSPQMTIGKFVESKFIPEHVASKKSSGQSFYRAMLKHVLMPEEVDRMFGANPGKPQKKLKTIPEWPYLGSKRFCDVQPDDIQRLISAANARGYSARTVRYIRNLIGAIFSHAIQCQYFAGENPVHLVKTSMFRRQKATELTSAQVIEAIKIMRYPEREITLIGVFTGMSPAEICGLQWGHVNLADEEVNENGTRIPPRTICVRKRWYRGRMERVQEACLRDLPISLPLLRILEQINRRSHSAAPEDYVLTSSVGTPIDQDNSVRRRLRPIARQLGLPSLSWQTIRRRNKVLAEKIDKEFAFSSLIIPSRTATVTAKDGARTANAIQRS